MKKWHLCLCLVTHLTVAGLIILSGCDSGKKARDEVTGNRAVKQYDKSKKDIEKITAQQAEKHKGILEEEKGEGKKE
jgi:hypothetical protein